MPITQKQAIDELNRRKSLQQENPKINITKEQAIAELNRRKSQQPQNPKRKANFGDIAGLALRSLATGQGRQLAEVGSGMLANTPKLIPQVRESLQPETPAEKFTLAASNVAGAVAPISPLNMAGAKIATAIPKALGGGLASKALGLATAGAVENTAFVMPDQTEEYLNPEKAKERAIYGAVGGVTIPAVIGGVGSAIRGTGKILEKMPTKLYNEIIRPQTKDFAYGKNPARTFLKRKITSNDIVGLDDFVAKTSDNLKEVGKQLDESYRGMQGTFDITKEIVNPVTKEIAKLSKRPSENANLIKKLQATLDDNLLMKTKNLSPVETWETLKEIGGLAKWTGNPSDDKVVNEVYQNMYRGISAKLKQANPVLRGLNTEYGDLLTGLKRIEKMSAQKERNGIFSLGNMLYGFTRKDPLSMIAGTLGAKAIATPLLKTRVANALNNENVQNIAKIMQKSPKFTDMFNSVYGTKVETPEEIKSVVGEIVERPNNLPQPQNVLGLPNLPKGAQRPQFEAGVEGGAVPMNMADDSVIQGLSPELSDRVRMAQNQRALPAGTPARPINERGSAPVNELAPQRILNAQGEDISAINMPQVLKSDLDNPNMKKASTWEGLKNVPESDRSLYEEALKYDSAEEFAKGQGEVVYHGTDADFEIFDPKFKGYATGAESAKGAFWFTDDEATAKAYAVYAAEDAPVQRLLKQAEEAEKIAQKTGKESDWEKYDKLVEESEKLAEYDATFERRQKKAKVKEAYVKGNFLEIDAEGKTPQELSSDSDIDSWLNSKIKEAIKKNKAGLKIINIDDAVGLYNKPSTHYAVFNPEQIKTKSQLTDIYNKAHSKTNNKSAMAVPAGYAGLSATMILGAKKYKERKEQQKSENKK
jgi:hypothetical protein